jgi:RNA polymerase sigma factor (sigma-70 family)
MSSVVGAIVTLLFFWPQFSQGDDGEWLYPETRDYCESRLMYGVDEDGDVIEQEADDDGIIPQPGYKASPSNNKKLDSRQVATLILLAQTETQITIRNQAIGALLINYLPQINAFLRTNYRFGNTPLLEPDDLKAEAQLHFIEAIKKYRFLENTENTAGNFFAYARNRMSKKLADYIDKNRLQRRFKKTDEAKKLWSHLKLVQNDSLSRDDVATKLNVNPQTVAEFRQFLHESISLLPFHGEDNETNVGLAPEGRVYRDTDNPSYYWEDKNRKMVLDSAISMLDEREQRIIRAFYYEQMSVSELAIELKISVQRIRQIRDRAFTKLKEYLGSPEDYGITPTPRQNTLPTKSEPEKVASRIEDQLEVVAVHEEINPDPEPTPLNTVDKAQTLLSAEYFGPLFGGGKTGRYSEAMFQFVEQTMAIIEGEIADDRKTGQRVTAILEIMLARHLADELGWTFVGEKYPTPLTGYRVKANKPGISKGQKRNFYRQMKRMIPTERDVDSLLDGSVFHLSNQLISPGLFEKIQQDPDISSAIASVARDLLADFPQDESYHHSTSVEELMYVTLEMVVFKALTEEMSLEDVASRLGEKQSNTGKVLPHLMDRAKNKLNNSVN